MRDSGFPTHTLVNTSIELYKTISSGTTSILVSDEGRAWPIEPVCSNPPYSCIFIVNPSLVSSFKVVTDALSNHITSKIWLSILSSSALFIYSSSFGSVVEVVSSDGIVIDGVSLDVVAFELGLHAESENKKIK